MRDAVLRLFFIVLCVSAYANASEAKGYKVVLASFPTFSEAKQAMESSGKNMGEKERSLPTEYHFEIVARPSGKAFVLAAEPLKTQKDADTVAKNFKRLYPGAYINGYYGPTKGAVFLKPSIKIEPIVADITVESNTTAEANITKVTVASEKNTTAPIVEKVIDEKSLISPDAPKSNRLIYILAFGMVIIGYLIIQMRLRKKVTPTEDTKQVHLPEDLFELIEAEAETEENGSDLIPEATVKTPKTFEPERDIFYKLKKNIFFMTLLEELKEASEAKDIPRCQDLMDEIMRYQKNFRQSVIIASMKGLIENKMFDQLSELITKEMN
jgi:hypothetical protein